MLINMEEMLKVADKNQFAVGAFNATERQKRRMRRPLYR